MNRTTTDQLAEAITAIDAERHRLTTYARNKLDVALRLIADQQAEVNSDRWATAEPPREPNLDRTIRPWGRLSLFTRHR